MQYVIGAPVEVFYNPANPEQAVLERRSGSNRALMFAVVLIAVILIATVAVTTGLMGSFGGMFSNLFNFSANTAAPIATSANPPSATKIVAPTATLGSNGVWGEMRARFV